MTTAFAVEKAARHLRPRTNGGTPEKLQLLLPPREAAHIIRSDIEALEVAHQLAHTFAQGASLRDRERRLPIKELAEFSHSGFLGITVPKEYGGAGVSHVTLAEVTAIISEADSSLGQIPQNHFYMVEAVRSDGSDAQKQFYFARVLAGERFGNAFCELGTKTVFDFQARLREEKGKLVLSGKKFYSTGALFAHWVPVVAKDDEGKLVIVFVKRDSAGLTIIDDGSSFGQRITASGTVIIDEVEVTPFEVLRHHASFDRSTPVGPIAQIIHAAADVGIARAALADTIRFVRQHTRPWIDGGQEHNYEDPYVIAQIANVQVRVHAADALLECAGRSVDKAVATPDDQSVAEASIAVAEAKVLSTEVAILATNKLFELAGGRATLQEYNLDRHWRNARTHTLHDPVRRKYHVIGNF